MTNELSPEEEILFDSLLDYLSQSRGFDFSSFKRSTLRRRIIKRMESNQIATFAEYLTYLEQHPEEFQPLFNTILINVTSFFRDPQVWTYLQEELLPSLVNAKLPNDPIRCWSAGCASGEEAYTIAIVLAEILGLEQFKERVKIFATDIDEAALQEARRSEYTGKQLESVPEELRAKYFILIPRGDYYFLPELRRNIIFGSHNLFKDAPISHIDLLICRNTLMYFTADTQSLILNRFHFSLNHSGVLVLGKAEMLLTQGDMLKPLNLQHRIFNCVPPKIEKIPPLSQAIPTKEEDTLINIYLQLQEIAFESAPIAQIILDREGNLVRSNQVARTWFNLQLLDVGKPLQDLEFSYRPLELRSLMERVYREQSMVNIPNVVHQMPDGTTKYLDIQINPLGQLQSSITGIFITATDVTALWHLEQDLEKANRALTVANTELQTTNEELETTNEELQSTNEELETTNEELQSTNEELETLNEELRVTNEELQSLNDEVNYRTAMAAKDITFLNAVLSCIRYGVIVIDRQSNILIWNQQSEELWGLRSTEVQGQSIFGLDIGLPINQIVEPIRRCLNDEASQQTLTLSAVNRRGRSMECNLKLDLLINDSQEKLGVIITIEEVGADTN
ncbi:MAG: CheR family methyltransferase [Snowella sp.]|nr:CheR family methyltransferase [Snowella sp.]